MKRLTEWFEKYERGISTLSLVGGFIFDNLTLRRIDVVWDNALICVYLLLIGVCIILINLHEDGRLGKRFDEYHPWFLFFMQFAIGGLFSVFSIFYFRSSTIGQSWPFVAFLFTALIGNEFLKARYQRLSLQVTIYFTAFFSYAIFVVPIILGKIGANIFILSGCVSLLYIVCFIVLMSYITKDRFVKFRKLIIIEIAFVFTLINVFYFTNLIPPIPLSLQEIGVYNFVGKNGDNTYTLQRSEPKLSWWHFQTDSIESKGGPLYVYSSVFAPTRLSANIVHVWQYHNDTTNSWVTASRIQFPIAGGRDQGYRGYSEKQNVSPGLWRVNVETIEGRLVGRVSFEVI